MPSPDFQRLSNYASVCISTAGSFMCQKALHTLPKAVTGKHTYGNSSFTPQCLQKANRKFPTRMSGERLAGQKHLLYYLMNRSSRYLGNVQRSSSTRSSSLSIW